MVNSKNTKDYSNGKIYIIKNSINELTYIGSTTQTLSQRMAQHRKATRNPTAKRYKIYRCMRDLGVENLFIELIEYHTCNTQEELRRREGQLIKEFQPDLNKHVAGRTLKEYRQDFAEEIKQKDRIRGKSESVLQRRRERKYECCCGSIVRTDGKAEHLRTKKHQEYIKKHNDTDGVGQLPCD